MEEGFEVEISPEQAGREEAMSEAEMSRNIAENWDRFVGEKGKGDRKRFLVGILEDKGCKEVCDLGLGLGTDTISIQKAGFQVASNEIDPEYLSRARENAVREGVELDVTDYDWRDLSEVGSGSFDALVLMGNSFTHLMSREDQIKALEEFRRVLRFGGVLIIDERNYQDILDRRKEILADPLQNFNLKHKDEPGKATYSEEGVKVVPTEVSEKGMTLSHYDVDSHEFIARYPAPVYPFKRGELQSLLKEVGFSTIAQYSDLQEGYDQQADFYEYVAEK
jgi:SAM-dependent methyltransferase